MVRIRTIAALVSFLAGAWSLAGANFYGLGKYACTANPTSTCVGSSSPNPYVSALAILLEISSVICLLGPNQVFYASAILSILLGASIAPDSSIGDPIVAGALGLAGASFVLSLVAARKRTGISEQSNPMNLPVFG